MSKTDKDRPLWVRSNDNTERRVAQHFIRRPWSPTSMIDCTDNCTIDTETAKPRHMWHPDDGPCIYFVDVTNYGNTANKAYRRTRYHRPRRQAGRIYGVRAAQAFNSGVEWDDEGVVDAPKKVWRF